MHKLAANSSHTVATDQFEGPLALLLELAEHSRLKVTDISIAKITSVYLASVRELKSSSPEDLSDFLQLGARLLYVKSLALLPRESAAEQEKELRQLNLELDDYRRYQEAARELARINTGSSWQRPVVSRLMVEELPLPDVSLSQLTEAFRRALGRTVPARPQGVIQNDISQEMVTKKLKNRLAGGPLELTTLLDEARDRLEIIITFLTVLELIKQHELRVTQDQQFGSVILEMARG